MSDRTAETRQTRIQQSFDAAEGYDAAAVLQRVAAHRLFEIVTARLAGRIPRRILEIGCGTGFLTEMLRAAWPEAELIATDIAPRMLERARARVGVGVQFCVMDAAQPVLPGTFDLICGNLVFQWLPEPEAVLQTLAEKLSAGGVVALSTVLEGTFEEWRAACTAEGFEAATPDYPSIRIVENWRPGLCAGQWTTERCVQPFESGLAFVKHLKETGASVPREGAKMLSPADLRRVLTRFDQAGAMVTWHLAYGCFQKPARAGVFVTGTDTGVGKTLTSACLVHAWKAAYWKPLQSGLADEEGDTATVMKLSGCLPEDCLSPAGAYQASLSPLAAAKAEGAEIDPARLSLPLEDPARPMVVEGAGGLMVPATETLMMIDLAEGWGLPVVLVARSGLGTLNHTLLSLNALRARGLAVAGVVLSGPLNPENRKTIEEKGQVRILAELPQQDAVTADTVAALSRLIPSWGAICAAPKRD
ncbi:dethiobiotin synthase [Acetobacter orleanensis]|uniref:ATP-dependent dethiobiotin synthetase BioD n=1 Tax=Acetobacter orleanensis TaxID=104099 RepID=A0A4Y3TL52_9PROT|nr:dethiobiotin synthase [Acetobacter orleanensis]KXV62043.1 dethiobiotin synthase [Acetobacter orleanensis]PCD80377.1 dethiobiotin synthase [Acetobacter orleanensis]GAN68865.1 biotin synthesis protein [Acetobacter orleanensis JCM 7639]GBR30915.1 biotin synthesis protein [Acetobacter orleanensis NRIC 0473]GEB81727.1 dethiobiotin synthase [Acetobacter orleanensis]